VSQQRRLRTGEVAARAGVSIATLRYYERRGLIAEPVRTPSGYRAYPPETVIAVRAIKRAQRLGFTLREIRAMLETRRRPRATCGDLCRQAEDKIGELSARIRSLTETRDALEA